MTKKTILEKDKHSPIGASSCERWWNCPASVELSKKAPPASSSSYAIQGTAAHTVAENLLSGTNSFSVGDIIVVDGMEVVVDEETLDYCSQYANFIREEASKTKGGTIQVEKSLNLSHLDPEAFGKADAIILNAFSLTVYDLKFGAGIPVEVNENKQLLYYALGAFYSIPEEDRETIEWVETVIYQPRAFHPDGPVRSRFYTIKELMDFEISLKEAMGRVRSKNPEVNPGKWCRFCNYKFFCDKYGSSIEGLTGAKELTLPDPESLSPEQISDILQKSSIIKDWVKSIEELSYSKAIQGIEIPGYKLVESYGHRKWVDSEKVIEKFGSIYSEKIYNKTLKTPPQLEKILSKADKEEVKKYVEKPLKGKTLVPVSDSRDEIPKRNAFEDYKEDFEEYRKEIEDNGQR